jgi:hypothetical protein
MKTLEELAQQYISTIADTHSVKAACEKAFMAGYKAAQEHAHAALEEAEARMEEIKDQVAGVSKVMPDTCEHILDMGKMVDVNGWISVKDRLPEIEGEYLAFGYSASDAARWIVVMYDPKDEFWYELSSDWDWTDDVTHWQELPEPPKEEK